MKSLSVKIGDTALDACGDEETLGFSMVSTGPSPLLSSHGKVCTALQLYIILYDISLIDLTWRFMRCNLCNVLVRRVLSRVRVTMGRVEVEGGGWESTGGGETVGSGAGGEGRDVGVEGRAGRGEGDGTGVIGGGGGGEFC